MSVNPIVPTAHPEPVIEKITPHRAAQLLAMNIQNRNVRKSVVARYAADMIHDRWHFNGAPILVGADGTLYDGQHRLLALVESGRPQTMVVIYGVEPEAKMTIDSGTARNPGDILAFLGISDSHVIAATAKLVMAYEAGRAFAGFRPSNSELTEWVADNPEITEAATVYSLARRRVPASPSVVAAAFYICSQIDADDAAVFFVNKFINTEGLHKGDPVLALRSRLNELAGRDTNVLKYDQFRYILTAWNAARDGRQVARISAPKGGWTRAKFPEPR